MIALLQHVPLPGVQNGSYYQKLLPNRKFNCIFPFNLRDDANENIYLFRKQITEKIEKINADLANSSGLTREEINTAILLGLIDSDQAYFWTEEWQKGYREAQREIEEGNYETFENIDNLLDYLHR